MGRRLQQTDSLESIYRKYAARVRWVLRGRGVPDSALDDLVHDVFLAIHRRLPSRNASLPLGTWIVGVARNVAFSYRRTLARASARERDVPTPAPWPAPDDALARREAWVSLDAFLGGLKPAQREVFVLVDVLGMPAAEVARSTGTETNTVYSRLRLARRKFEEHFTELDVGDAKAAFLQRARKQGLPPVEQRRRAWAAIAAEVRTLAPLAPGTSVLAKLGLGMLGVGVAAAVGMAVLPEEPRPAAVPLVRPSVPTPSPPSPPIPRVAKAEAVPSVTPPPSTAQEPPVATPRIRPRPRIEASGPSPVDDVTVQVERLRAVKATLNRGELEKALGLADRFVEDFPKSPLKVDAHRIQRKAACGLGRSQRAADAARHLRALGVNAPTPACEKKSPPF